MTPDDADDTPRLGLATNRALLEELTARIEVDGNLEYRTVGFDGDKPREIMISEAETVLVNRTRIAGVFFGPDGFGSSGGRWFQVIARADDGTITIRSTSPDQAKAIDGLLESTK